MVKTMTNMFKLKKNNNKKTKLLSHQDGVQQIYCQITNMEPNLKGGRVGYESLTQGHCPKTE